MSIIGIFYMPGKILISNNALKEVNATVTEVRKSGNRVSYFIFKTKEYPGFFIIQETAFFRISKMTK